MTLILKKKKKHTLAALVRARAHRETAVSDLLELKNDTEHRLRAANSNAFHLKKKNGDFGSRTR